MPLKIYDNNHQTIYGVNFNLVQEILDDLRCDNNLSQVSLIASKSSSFGYIAFIETEFDNTPYIRLFIIQDYRFYRIMSAIVTVLNREFINLSPQGWKKVIEYKHLHIFKQYKLPYKPFYLNRNKGM